MAKAAAIPGLDERARFADAARSAVAVRTEEVFAHADGVLATDDIRGVHDMRVATRRLRAVLEVFGPAFEPVAHRTILRDVKALADALGARRDPDVQLARLAVLRPAFRPEDEPGLDLFAQRLLVEQAQANQRLAIALEEVRRSGLHERLRALLAPEAR